jgi:hypothetical protein
MHYPSDINQYVHFYLKSCHHYTCVIFSNIHSFFWSYGFCLYFIIMQYPSDMNQYVHFCYYSKKVIQKFI